MLGPGDAVSDPRLQVELGGIQLANPVGIAAGFDKDSEMLGAFAALGFGYVIPGSVRPRPAGDLPSPKLVRYPDRESMINSQGMPSKGARYVAGRLRAYRQHERRTRIIANITGWTVEEYVEALEALQAGADGIELSLSCPNETYDETVDFLAPAKFTGLIERLNERRRIPLFVKIRNYNNSEERDNRFELIELCLKLGVDGVTLPGSHIVDEPRLAARRGNLSGKAVFPKTVDNVRDVYKMSGGRIAIKALGGVFTGKDAFDAISAGASSVELLTGLVYEGWSIAQKINRSLLELLQASGIPDVQALRGTAVGSAADDATRSGVAAAVAPPRAG
jgi:dihydroorotate dehydrogenase (fumarate)/dihydroorotate dehydrogenase